MYYRQNFRDKEATAPGYLTAIMVLGYELKPAVVGEGPATTAKRSEDKVGIKYRYSSTQIDVSKSTFKEAIETQNYIKDECWINSIYDFYKDSLLRPDKKRNLITREIILKDLDRTEENIKNGLTIYDVLPFFQKHKPKLRGSNIFYKCIFKYDPPVENYNNKPMYVVADGDL